MLKYTDGKWQPVTDMFLLTKTEAQVWLALLYLICEPECARRYQYNTYRREMLQRVRVFEKCLAVCVCIADEKSDLCMLLNLVAASL